MCLGLPWEMMQHPLCMLFLLSMQSSYDLALQANSSMRKYFSWAFHKYKYQRCKLKNSWSKWVHTYSWISNIITFSLIALYLYCYCKAPTTSPCKPISALENPFHGFSKNIRIKGVNSTTHGQKWVQTYHRISKIIKFDFMFELFYHEF